MRHIKLKAVSIVITFSIVSGVTLIGEQLVCQREVSNTQDAYVCIAVMRGTTIVSHVPRKISAACEIFFAHSILLLLGKVAPHIENIGAAGCSFFWKNLYNTIVSSVIGYTYICNMHT